MTRITQDELRSTLDEIVLDPDMPLASLSAAIVRDDRLVFHHYSGRRWIDPLDSARDEPVDADTLFRVASISKLITAIGVMRLVQAGTLDLRADVSDLLGFALRNPHFPDSPITLEMLLSHTSSLRDDAGYSWPMESGLRLGDILLPGGKVFGSGAMWDRAAPPGDFFSYANLASGVIATVMERATGVRFDKLIGQLVLDPLGLTGGFNPIDFPAIQQQNIATLYRKRGVIAGREVWNPAGPWVPQTDDFRSAPIPIRVDDRYAVGSNGTLTGPQGNCRLSANGLARVTRMMINHGTLDGVQMLSPESVARMTTPDWRFDPQAPNGNSGGEFSGDQTRAMNAWGLGVHLFTDISDPGRGDRLTEPGGVYAAGHLGDAYGLTSAIVWEIDRQTQTPTGNGYIFLVGGVGSDPEAVPGKYSAMRRYEERILTALASLEN